MCRTTVPFRAFGAILVALGAGCSSSGSPYGPVGTASASPVATRSPIPSGVASSQPATEVIVAGAPLPLPSAGGLGGSVEFSAGGSIPAGAMLTVRTYAGAPPGAPAPQARRRDAGTPSPSPSPSVLVVEALQYAGIPLAVVPLLANVPTVTTFTGPQFTNTQRYEAELFDASTGALVESTSGFVAGNTATFVDALIGMQTLDPYLLEIVVDSTLPPPAATPTPAPSPLATQTPAASPSPFESFTATATPGAGGNAKLYVANFYPSTSNQGSITIYPADVNGTQNEAPLATISGTNTELDQPAGVAVDAAGEIYVVNARIDTRAQASVNVYAANPSGLANVAPIAQIGGSNTGLSFPEGIALDASGKIYVANASNAITVYAANPTGTQNETPIATISGGSTGLNLPESVAIDSSGRIYVANAGNASVTVYAANPSGTLNEAPLATIVGGSTNINQPTGIALDASGKIYVANTGSPGAITIFAADPSGTVNDVPLATITNNQSGYTANGLVIDASGDIFASNGNGDVRAFAFPPTPASTEAPFGTITGSSTGLVSPLGMAIR